MTNITITGNTTSAAELRFTASGKAVASFTVAVNERRYDKTTNEWVDDGATFYPCAAWGPMGENAAELLADKGVRVIVTGRLKSRSYETREGEKRTVFEIDVEEVGPSLAWATARVTRSGQQQAKPRQQRAADPWAGPSTEAPF